MPALLISTCSSGVERRTYAGEVADLVERGEVGQEGGGGHPAAAQRARLGIELRAVAAVDEHARAAGVQLARDGAAEPVGRAGDEHHGVLDRSHAVGRSTTRGRAGEVRCRA